MNIILFGATGMIGQGVLRECLLDPEISLVLAVGRSGTGVQNPKLHDLVHADLLDYAGIEDQLRGFDACFFCLGVSSGGMKEADYIRATYGIALAAAENLVRLNPSMTFIYVSGAGTDSSETGRTMWARVKGRTENAIGRLPFRAVYLFRPAVVQPLHGERSKTAAYRILYRLTRPLLPVFRSVFPAYVVTTEEIGRAMIRAVKAGAPKKILESVDIARLGRA